MDLHQHSCVSRSSFWSMQATQTNGEIFIGSVWDVEEQRLTASQQLKYTLFSKCVQTLLTWNVHCRNVTSPSFFFSRTTLSILLILYWDNMCLSGFSRFLLLANLGSCPLGMSEILHVQCASTDIPPEEMTHINWRRTNTHTPTQTHITSADKSTKRHSCDFGLALHLIWNWGNPVAPAPKKNHW